VKFISLSFLVLVGCVGDVATVSFSTDAGGKDASEVADGGPGLDANATDAGTDTSPAADSGVWSIPKLPSLSLCLAPPYREYCIDWDTNGLRCTSANQPCTSGYEFACTSSADCVGHGNACGISDIQVSDKACPSTATMSRSVMVCADGFGGAPFIQVCQSDSDCLNLHSCRAVSVTRGVTTLKFGVCL